MPRLDLSFASREDSLSVRHFAVREPISGLFEVGILARSPLDEIDLEGIVGQSAAFALMSGVQHLSVNTRVWTGICNHMELVQAEQTGLSTYFLTIVPVLWRTTLRKNNRIFQHMTIPAIVSKVLGEWQIEPEERLSEQYPTYEYRVQYGETDFAFIGRLLEEAGITYFFTHDGSTTRLVFSDEPEKGDPRPALLNTDNPNLSAQQEFITKVKLAQQVRPGRVTMRDFDFRNKLDYQLFSEARAGEQGGEVVYEQYEYSPGAFWFEPGKGGDTPVADDKGVARTDEKIGNLLVTRTLDGERRTRRKVVFEANVVDLSPGTLMTIAGHPRKDLADKRLLVIDSSLEGTPNDDWKLKGESVFADVPYRPERKTSKPRIHGVQSAVVVGPPGEEIHTDEFGRVRVQFHWDREGSYDDHSSCWIRVSQGWAGAGYGLLNVPRVGQEVLVEFFEGDPDRPVITGRVFSNTRRVLYKLPDDKTKSGWKSETSPGGGGFNELSFEDAAGREVIHIQAQKDFTELVKHDQSSTVLHDRSASVTNDDSENVGGNQSFSIVGNQSHTIGKVQRNDVGESRVSTIAHADTIDAGDAIRGTVGKNGVGYAFVKDQNITITNNVASIVFKPEGIWIDAKGDLAITANGTLKLSGGTVLVDGTPNVYVNCSSAATANVPTLPAARAPKPPTGPGTGGETIDPQSKLSGHGTVEDPGGIKEVSVDLASLSMPATPSVAPSKVTVDPSSPIASSATPADLTGKEVANLLNRGQSAAILQSGAQELMVMRTQAAPQTLESVAIDTAVAQSRALGLSPTDAQAAGLAESGVALFRGDGAGAFTKIIPPIV